MKKSERPDEIPPPKDAPYSFSDWVHLVQKDMYYGRAIHELVRYARENPKDEQWAFEQIAGHVKLPEADLSELGIRETAIDRCSNTTKLYMLDFCRYV